jgi:hypothetical protein
VCTVAQVVGTVPGVESSKHLSPYRGGLPSLSPNKVSPRYGHRLPSVAVGRKDLGDVGSIPGVQGREDLGGMGSIPVRRGW